MRLEEVSVETGDDVHDVAQVRREALAGLSVVPIALRLGDEGGSACHLRGPEVLEQFLCDHRHPRVRGVRGEGLVHLLMVARLLVLEHCQAALLCLGDLLQAVRTLVSLTSSEPLPCSVAPKFPHHILNLASSFSKAVIDILLRISLCAVFDAWRSSLKLLIHCRAK